MSCARVTNTQRGTERGDEAPGEKVREKSPNTTTYISTISILCSRSNYQQIFAPTVISG